MDKHDNDIKTKGFVDTKPAPDVDMVKEITRMRSDKNAIILAHYYQEAEIQDIADYLGDSLGLSQKAAETDADMIVFAGVDFMAETAKMLSPDKKVLIPDKNAGCSLANSAKAEDFARFKENYPHHIVISYVNTTAEIKALSDVCVTSGNAVKIVESFPKDQKIIFAPDKHLGGYINSITGRNMVLWDGACHVHEQFSVEELKEVHKQHPQAKVIVHPECEKAVREKADFIGSTAKLLNFIQNDTAEAYIVATEWGILNEMRRKMPEKTFIPAPTKDENYRLSECNYMKMNTLEKLYLAMYYEQPEITLSNKIIEKARKPIEKMLELTAK